MRPIVARDRRPTQLGRHRRVPAGGLRDVRVMYSTQAILPELGREFDVGPARAGLTVSVVVLAIAVGVWFWGPLFRPASGCRRTMITASCAARRLRPSPRGLAPTFEALLVCRTLQGLCMPGLLTVGLPYVMEAFCGWLGGGAMGVLRLLARRRRAGRRVGVALVGRCRRMALGRRRVGGVAGGPCALLMLRALPDVGVPIRHGTIASALPAQAPERRARAHVARRRVALFFMFVGTFHVRHLPAPGSAVRTLGNVG